MIHAEHDQAQEQSGANVTRVHLAPLEQTEQGEKLFNNASLVLVANVAVRLEVIAGETEISIGELFELRTGSVLALDQFKEAPLSIRLDGKPIAQGRLVAVNEHFGIEITQLADTEDQRTGQPG